MHNSDKRRIKLIILGIAMLRAGTEKAFLSFARKLDPEKYDVTLMLASKSGPLLDEIPDWIRVRTFPDEYAVMGDFFLMSGANAASTMKRCFIDRSFGTAFEILPYFVRILFSSGKKRSDIATRMWVEMAEKHLPQITLGDDGEPRFDGQGGSYDVAAAYWGDRTMFWMCDRVSAKRKLAWLHFDYHNPPREDELYLDYFSRCDAVITVSDKVDKALKQALPQVADKCVMMENIREPERLRDLMLRGEGFGDYAFDGKRVLSIGRICYQKGFDMIIPALKRLLDGGMNVRWYIVGGGDEEDVKQLKSAALSCGVAHALMILGPKDNPYGYIRECDLYVQPSRHEGKPITVEEAKMLRCPIVATRYLSASEQLDGGNLGLICDISSEGIYKAVKRMLEDPYLCDEFTTKLFEIDFGNDDEMKKFDALALGVSPKEIG